MNGCSPLFVVQPNRCRDTGSECRVTTFMNAEPIDRSGEFNGLVGVRLTQSCHLNAYIRGSGMNQPRYSL